jgi:hypothetical protein
MLISLLFTTRCLFQEPSLSWWCSPLVWLAQKTRTLIVYTTSLINLKSYFNKNMLSLLTYSTGQIPGSPKPSPFSNLPDMSPKKVSSSHNVYVSPLRQTKVFSRSIHLYVVYACFSFCTVMFLNWLMYLQLVLVSKVAGNISM